MKKRGRTIQSNVQASVADVIAARIDDGELDAAATPLLGLDRVQEFRSPLDLPGYRDGHFLDHLDSIFARIQRAPLGLTLGFDISFYVSSTGRLAILQLLSSQARKKMLEELLKRK